MEDMQIQKDTRSIKLENAVHKRKYIHTYTITQRTDLQVKHSYSDGRRHPIAESTRDTCMYGSVLYTGI